MKEESQIEEMRAALRGDRERADQTRQRSTENVRALIDEPPMEVTREPSVEPRRGFLSRLFGR